jgi:hypothetical protein
MNDYKIIDDKVKFILRDLTYAEIDLEDLERVRNEIKPGNFWYKNKAGYILGLNRNNKIVLLHRFITSCPKGLVVDHLNHFKWDNKKENLKVCTIQENNKNKINYSAAYAENKRFDKKRGVLKVNENNIEPLLTNQDVLDLLNINERTLYDYRENQGLPYFKLNKRTFRYDKQMVLDWLQNRLENNQESQMK